MNRSINVQCYLVLKPTMNRIMGEDRVKSVSAEVRSKRPSLGPNDQALHLNMTVPESLFLKPKLSASIEVPEHDAPPVITPEIINNIAEVVRERTGIHLTIQAPDAEEAPND